MQNLVKYSHDEQEDVSLAVSELCKFCYKVIKASSFRLFLVFYK